MSDRPRLVVDNSVLSAFHNAGWLDGPRVWKSKFDLVTPQRVWEGEFRPHHSQKKLPRWLSTVSVDLTQSESEVPNRLSLHDWSGIIAAESVDGSVLVTNDSDMKDTAERRGVETLWGTAFAIQTFQTCGISVESFENGVDNYVDDVTLNDRVVADLRSTEKHPE